MLKHAGVFVVAMVLAQGVPGANVPKKPAEYGYGPNRSLGIAMAETYPSASILYTPALTGACSLLVRCPLAVQ